ncbi:MAG: hypothetical protein HC869_17920 [Rhodospirillales bacterium]|nr:hypothetical protein [Rhodospirillales bacterium]
MTLKYTSRKADQRLHIERPDDTVVIIADKESDAGMVAKIMDEVRLAGITIMSPGSSRPR